MLPVQRVLACGVETEFGGAECDIFTMCLVGEELAVGDLGFAVIMDQCWKMANLFGEAMKKNRQGISQIGTTEPKAGPQGYSWLRPGNEEQTVKVRDLPSPQLPEK